MTTASLLNVDIKQNIRLLTDHCCPATSWLHFVILHHSIAIDLVTLAVTPSEHISALLAMNHDENQECAERRARDLVEGSLVN